MSTKDDAQVDLTHILVEEYKLYIEMMDRTSSRRLETNKFYISLLTALLGALAFILENKISVDTQSIVLFAISILGILLCLVWSVNIRSYRQINSLKFEVIHELEVLLPFACYKREWDILRGGKKTYRRLTNVELYIPLILGLPYLVLMIYSIYSLVY